MVATEKVGSQRGGEGEKGEGEREKGAVEREGEGGSVCARARTNPPEHLATVVAVCSPTLPRFCPSLPAASQTTPAPLVL